MAGSKHWNIPTFAQAFFFGTGSDKRNDQAGKPVPLPPSRSSEDDRDKGPLRICLVGLTGSGKSSLGNVLLGWSPNGVDVNSGHTKKGFDTTGGTDLCTTQTSSRDGYFRLPTAEGHPGQNWPLRIIDTPGQGGATERNLKTRLDMVKFLKTEKQLNAIVFVRNSETPRLDAAEVELFKILVKMFGEEKFFKNLVVVFTRWSLRESEVDRRKASGEHFKQAAENFRETLKNIFSKSGRQISNLACIPIDALHNGGNEREVRSFNKNCHSLWQTLCKLPPAVNVEDVKFVQTEEEQLKQQIEETRGLIAQSTGAISISDRKTMVDHLKKLLDESTNFLLDAGEAINKGDYGRYTRNVAAAMRVMPDLLVPIVEFDSNKFDERPTAE